MGNRGFSRSDALACMCCTVVLGAIVVSCAQDDPEVNNSAAPATDAASVTAPLEAAWRAATERSDMLRFMEPRDQWVGNVVVADGHIERYLEPFKMHASANDQFFETRDPASNDL